jgi:hypothetical protein
MSFRLVSSPGECALAPRRPGSPGHLSPRWERAAINHIGKNGQQAKLFCRAPRCRCLLLRSKRVPHASALGERISGYRKVSRASAASNANPMLDGHAVHRIAEWVRAESFTQQARKEVERSGEARGTADGLMSRIGRHSFRRTKCDGHAVS